MDGADPGQARGESAGPSLGAALVAGLLVAAALASPAIAELRPWSDGAKPGFTLPSLDHGRVHLEDQRGRVVLVHFFATWCEPCRPEMASLQRLAERYERRPLTILAVDVAEVEPRIRRFFAAQPVSFAILLDADRSVTRTWKVESLPTTFVLDPSLTPRLVTEGDLDWDHPAVDRAIGMLLTGQDEVDATIDSSTEERNP